MASSRIPKLAPEIKEKRSVSGWNYFEEGTRVLLSRWDLLRTAVVEEWAGRGSKGKFERILSDLLMNCHEQWSEGNDLHEDTLDVYLLECLETDFNIDFQDDTGVTILSLLIQSFYRLCAGGAIADARALLSRLDARPDFNHDARNTRIRAESDEDSDEDDGGEGEDSDEEKAGGGAASAGAGDGSSRRTLAVDEDGWATIPVRGGGRAAAENPALRTATSSTQDGAGSADGAPAPGPARMDEM